MDLEYLKKKLKKTFDDITAQRVVSPVPQKQVQPDPIPLATRAMIAVGNSPVGKGIVQLQKDIENRALPKINLQQHTQSIQKPVPRMIAQTGAMIAEDLVNLPQRLVEGGGRIGTQIVRPLQERRSVRPMQAVGAVASAAEPLLDVATMGGGTILKGIGKNTGKIALKTAGKQTAKQTIRFAAKRGAMEGAAAGAAFGGLRGLSEGDEADLKNFAVGAGAGLVFGGVLGSATGGISSVLHLIKRPPAVEKQLRDLQGKYVKGDTPIKPKNMSPAQWNFQQDFNRKYSRNPYTPVYHNDLKEAAQYETGKRGVGLSIRDVSKDKAPLSTSGKIKLKTNSAQPGVDSKKINLPGIQNDRTSKIPGLSQKGTKVKIGSSNTTRGSTPMQSELQQSQLPSGGDPKDYNLTSSLPSQGQIISQDARRALNGSQVKEKRIAFRMKGSNRYPEPVRQALEGTYVGIRNEDTINTAKQVVRHDAQAAEVRAMNPKNATDQAIGIELFNHYMDHGQVQRANAIMNATSGTNEGQMVQILSQYDKSTPGGAIKFATNLVKNYNKANPNKPLELTDEMVQGFYKKAKGIQSMPEGKERNIASNNLINEINQLIPSTIGDKFIAVWKAGLLTSLRTQERNLLGNSIHNVAEVAKDLPASIADSLMSLKTGNRSLTFTGRGIGSGAKEGFKAGKDILTMGYDPEQAINKYDVKQVVWGDNPVERGLKLYTDIVFRSLGASDKPFYNAAFARSLHDQAGALAINAGKQGDGEFIQGLVKHPTVDMLKRATNDANTATFKNTNMLTQIAGEFKRVARKNEFTKVGSEVVMPFTGVPSAIAGQIVAYSPAGLIKGAVNMGRVLAGNVPDLQRQAAQEVGRGVIGTGLAGLGAYLVQQGIMTGQPKDQAEARQWELEGKQRNSVLINGKWRSINSIGPESLVILAGAKAQEELNKGDEASISTLGANLGKDFLSQTFLQGVQGPLQAVNEPDRYAKSYIGNQAASIVPNIVKDTAKAGDSFQRENNTVTDYITNSLPGVRNGNIVKRDPLGNPMAQEPTGAGAFLDLFNSKTPISNPVVDELGRLNASGYNSTPGKIQKAQTINGEKMTLTPEQLNTLESEIGPQATEGLNELFQTPDYQALGDDEKAKAVDSLLESIRKQVRGNIDVNQEAGTASSDKQATGSSASGGKYTLITESGTVKRIDLSEPIEAPELTGNEDLDKKLTSKYKGQLTARGNDIVALYQAGKMDAKTAQAELEKLKSLSGSGKKGKKLNLGTSPKLKLTQVSAPAKMPTVTFKRQASRIRLTAPRKREAPGKIKLKILGKPSANQKSSSYQGV